MNRTVNRIGEPEQERLGLFAEEAGEVQVEIGKILRHGIDSYHPDEPTVSNAQRLELEAGHVLAAIDLLVACGTLSREALEQARRQKLQKLRSWLHCGTNLDAVEELLGTAGGHIYDEHGTSDCANGCGCWAGPSRSGGPDGVDPLGACPNAKPAEGGK